VYTRVTGGPIDLRVEMHRCQRMVISRIVLGISDNLRSIKRRILARNISLLSPRRWVLLCYVSNQWTRCQSVTLHPVAFSYLRNEMKSRCVRTGMQQATHSSAWYSLAGCSAWFPSLRNAPHHTAILRCVIEYAVTNPSIHPFINTHKAAIIIKLL